MLKIKKTKTQKMSSFFIPNNFFNELIIYDSNNIDSKMEIKNRIFKVI